MDLIVDRRSISQETGERWTQPVIAQPDLFGEVHYLPVPPRKKPEASPTLRTQETRPPLVAAKNPKAATYLNMHLVPINWRTEGIEEFPCLLPYRGPLPLDISGMDERIPSQAGIMGMHGFCYDHILIQKWHHMERVVSKARHYACAFGPQFSVLMDGRRCDAVEAVRKSRIATLYMQLTGIPTIQTVSITSVRFHAFAYDGLAPNTVTAIGNMCVLRTPQERKLYRIGVEELIRRKSPSLLIVVGNRLDFKIDIPVIYYKSRIQKLRDHDYQ